MVNAIVLLNLENAKTRLSSFFGLDQRRNMVLIMFSRILNVLEDYPITVLSRTHEASENGIKDIDDINNGIIDLRSELNDNVLILPCDLPLLTKEDVIKLMGNYKTLSIASSKDGGTGGLYIPRDLEFTPKFGKDSFETHVSEAKELGIPLRIYDSDNFRDFDTIEDLKWLMSSNEGNELADYISSLGLELPLD